MSQQAGLYLLPDPDCGQIEERQIIDILGILGAGIVNSVGVYRGASDWQSLYDHCDLVAERDQLSPLVFACLRQDFPNDLIRSEVDAFPLISAIEERLSGAPKSIAKWHPSYGRLFLGLHSIPDYEFERTIWRGHFSFSVFGEGMPEEPDLLIEMMDQDAIWNALRTDLSRVLGTSLVSRMEVFY